MSSLANRYQLLDSYDVGSGPPGVQGGGGSGQPISPVFTAPSAAAAQLVAFIFATCFQRPVRLANLGGTPPYTFTTSGQLPTVGITSCPSGIGY